MSAVSSPEIAIESPELHGGQVAVAQSEARFKVLVPGRRWGKTSLGVSECFHRYVEEIP